MDCTTSPWCGNSSKAEANPGEADRYVKSRGDVARKDGLEVLLEVVDSATGGEICSTTCWGFGDGGVLDVEDRALELALSSSSSHAPSVRGLPKGTAGVEAAVAAEEEETCEPLEVLGPAT